MDFQRRSISCDHRRWYSRAEQQTSENENDSLSLPVYAKHFLAADLWDRAPDSYPWAKYNPPQSWAAAAPQR